MSDNKEAQKSASGLSRRHFIGAAATSAAAFMVLPSKTLGRAGHTSPNEKLNVAVVGAGGMGGANAQGISFEKDGVWQGENIVALCDVDPNRIAWIEKDYPKAQIWQDYRQMLDKQKNIDAVIVGTPDHTHAVIAMACMKLGKHVYVQKPMTHTIKEARILTETAREMGVATQMGNQGQSGEGTRLVREWIQDGAIGKVREVHCWTDRPIWPQAIPTPTDTPPMPDGLNWDVWLGPVKERAFHPTYHPFGWRAWFPFGCGALGDMGCHIMNAPFYALDLKYPDSVTASASYHVGTWAESMKDYYPYESYPMASIVHYNFPARRKMPPVKVHWYDGGLRPERPEGFPDGRRMPDSGCIFIGSKAGLMCGGTGGSPRIFPEKRMKRYKRPKKTLKRIKTSHELNWAEACKGGDPASSNFDYSGPFTEMVLLGNLAIRRPNVKLTWDAEKMLTNDEEANVYVHKEYRKGWSL